MWNNLATIVGTGLTNDGYLKAINSPVSLAVGRFTQFDTPSIASIAQAHIVRDFVSTLTVSTLINASGASIVGIAAATADPLTLVQLNITSTASLARSEFRVGAIQSLTSTAIGEFEMRNQNGNLVLRPGASKLVAISVLRQDNTTDAYKTNSVFLTGWGSMAGATGAQGVSETATFGLTFGAAPIVVIGAIGKKSGAGVPSAITEFDTNGFNYAICNLITATNFVAIILQSNETNFPDQNSFGYSWHAIGEL